MSHHAVQRRGQQVALRLVPAPKVKGDCNGEPGYCAVYTCRENLVLEVTRAGSIHVLPTPHQPSVYLHVRQMRSKLVTPEVRALWDAEDDAISDATVGRSDWMIERYGSVCWRDVRKVLGEDATQEQLGEVWQVTRQRIEQYAANGERVLRSALGDGDSRPHGPYDLREILDALPHGSAVRPVEKT